MVNNILLRYKERVFNFFEKTDFFLNKKWMKRLCFGFILLISFTLIYILNRLQPLFGDDWNYSMLSDGHTRISNISDIFTHLYEHYFTWGGRIIVHIVAELLLLSGEHAADIINSLAYVIFTVVIYYIANCNNTLRPTLLILINFLIFFFIQSYGSTILWMQEVQIICGVHL